MEFVKLTSDTIKQQLLNLRQIVFEVTDSCNLKCKYCGYGEFYGSYDKREEQNLPFEKAKLLIDYLFSLWKDSNVDFYNRVLTVSFYAVRAAFFCLRYKECVQHHKSCVRELELKFV